MRLRLTSLLLTLSACTIIGDPKDPGDSDTDTSGPDSTSTSASSSTSDGSTTSDGTASEGTTTADNPTTSLTTTGGAACDGLDEVACAAADGCRAVFGAPLDFPGCTSQPAFLACIQQTDCGLMPTTVCRDGSLEVYVLDDTCVPPDFSACDSMLSPCGQLCVGLDEAACAMNPDCASHFGAPHVEQDQMICADFANPQFLACDIQQEPCPPVVLTVCPIGQPDVAFDVASGCIPPGFETCMDGPVLECP